MAKWPSKWLEVILPDSLPWSWKTYRLPPISDREADGACTPCSLPPFTRQRGFLPPAQGSLSAPSNLPLPWLQGSSSINYPFFLCEFFCITLKNIVSCTLHEKNVLDLCYGLNCALFPKFKCWSRYVKMGMYVEILFLKRRFTQHKGFVVQCKVDHNSVSPASF